MSNVWERFEGIVTKEEVADASSQFEPIEAGDYNVTLEAIAPSESKAGLPMLKGKFRMKDNNRIVFYNQMLQNINNPQMTAVNVGEANKFVNDLLGEDEDFDTLGVLAKRVEQVPIGSEYKINVSYGKKDTERSFPKIRIVSRSTEDAENPFDVSDGDIPF